MKWACPSTPCQTSSPPLPYYPALFEQAFGDPFIDLDRITDALIQFLRSIRSTSSRYDAAFADGFDLFTESELLGKSVFFRSDTRCNQCHSGLNFFATQPFINGLEVDYGRRETVASET